MEGSDLVKDVTCAEAVRLRDVAGRCGDGSELRRAAAAPREAAAARRRLRLRHQAEHPAAAGRARLPGARVPGVDAGRGAAGVEAGRHLPEQRPRRSGGGHLRDRQHQGDREDRCADVRHLPRPSADGARARREDLQAEVRSSRRQSSGEAAAIRARSRSRRRTTASRWIRIRCRRTCA